MRTSIWPVFRDRYDFDLHLVVFKVTLRSVKATVTGDILHRVSSLGA